MASTKKTIKMDISSTDWLYGDLISPWDTWFASHGPHPYTLAEASGQEDTGRCAHCNSKISWGAVLVSKTDDSLVRVVGLTCAGKLSGMNEANHRADERAVQNTEFMAWAATQPAKFGKRDGFYRWCLKKGPSKYSGRIAKDLAKWARSRR